MDVNSVYGSSHFLAASDLTGKEFELEIDRCECRDFDDGEKLVLSFVGAKKMLVLNKVNAQAIAAVYGTETNAWLGKRIVLFPSTTEYKGERTDCIRVRVNPVMPAADDDTPF